MVNKKNKSSAAATGNPAHSGGSGSTLSNITTLKAASASMKGAAVTAPPRRASSIEPRVRKISDAYVNQINVLRVFSKPPVRNTPAQAALEMQLEQIAHLSGQDERETQRCLFILEGQKLVTPLPPGDFTSKTWQITTDGVKALRIIGQPGY